jgi:hypothetical protein
MVYTENHCSTGLRRQELRDLYVRDIYQRHDGNVYVHVENGKGGRPREVQALPGHNEDVWTMQKYLRGFRATWMSILCVESLHKPFYRSQWSRPAAIVRTPALERLRSCCSGTGDLGAGA